MNKVRFRNDMLVELDERTTDWLWRENYRRKGLMNQHKKVAQRRQRGSRGTREPNSLHEIARKRLITHEQQTRRLSKLHVV